MQSRCPDCLIMSFAMHGSMIFRRLGAAAQQPASRFMCHGSNTMRQMCAACGLSEVTDLLPGKHLPCWQQCSIKVSGHSPQLLDILLAVGPQHSLETGGIHARDLQTCGQC